MILVLAAPPLQAQGVTTAAIQGRVEAAPSSPVSIASAEVLVTNVSNGQRWRVATDDEGRYFLETVPVGGPYIIQVRALGFAPMTRSSVMLALGQRYDADFVLVPVVVELEEITVTAAPDPRLNTARTGPAQTVDRHRLSGLPVLNRDVLRLALESPLANSTAFGLSIAGQPPPYNSFQIDGGVNSNLYGRFSPTPGGVINLVSVPGGGGLRTVPLDAVKEFQVLVSPFDVRQGSFAGGLINAVTRSGTNALQGSTFASLQLDELVGEDVQGEPIADFAVGQFGGALGGPIVRDRLHFFAAADLQDGTIPYQAPLIGTDTVGGADSVGVGIRFASASRFQSLLRDAYGVDPGTFGAVTGRNPAQSFFLKLGGQIGTNSLLEVSQSYVHGADRGLFLDREANGLYDLSSADIRFGTSTAATRVNWNAQLGTGISSELILAYFRVRDFCHPATGAFAFVSAFADRGVLNAGDKFSCAEDRGSLEQDALELTANLTFALGAHGVTVGTHEELLHFRDPAFPLSSGAWTFDSLDSLEQALPSFYFRQLPGPASPRGPLADYGVRQLGFYVQDRWSPLPHLTLTAGLRLDVPFFPDRPASNPLARSELGVETSVLPSGNLLWAPRLGFNLDVSGRGISSVRGGVGLFTGRPAYYLVGDAYRSTGREQLTLVCFGTDAPAFTLAVASQPAACRESGPAPVPIVHAMDRGLDFPQNLKAALGVDRRLPGGVVGTVDVLYSRATRQVFFRDVNLLPPVSAVSGEGDRPLYGTIDPATGSAVPRRRSPDFATVMEQTNLNGDWSFSVTGQLQGRVAERLDLLASYTWSRTADVLSLGGLGISLSGFGIPVDQIAATPLDGTRERPNRRTSAYDVPHRVRVAGILELPYGIGLSLIYQGSSGNPLTYVVEGDANADGFGPDFFLQQNDPIYVPRAAEPGGDVSLVLPLEDGTLSPALASEYQALEAFIRGERCLREQRGRLMRRNSCRDPWRGSLDLRLSKTFPTWRAQSVEVIADLFNVLNFLNRRWGLDRESVPFGIQELPVLRLVGFDPANDRGIYVLELPSLRNVDAEGSRWRMQLGLRYAF